jgi:toxin ParE1/3/4
MKVVYTEEALEDLDAIADWLIAHYPTVAPAVERRIRSVVAHIARWPESSRRSAKRPGVRAVPLSIQDFLSRQRRYGGDTPYPSRRAAAMG